MRPVLDRFDVLVANSIVFRGLGSEFYSLAAASVFGVDDHVMRRLGQGWEYFPDVLGFSTLVLPMNGGVVCQALGDEVFVILRMSGNEVR